MSQSSAAQNVAVASGTNIAPLPHATRRTELGGNVAAATASCNIGTSVSARFAETEWEARESQRQRELEEARARAAQMEKTMKWWSDCTANWREKWSKVRNERNKAREESKQLRANLDIAMKESNSYKREKNDLEIQIQQLKKEMEKVHALMMKHAGEFNRVDLTEATEDVEANCRDCSPYLSSDGLQNVNSEDGLVTKLTNNDTKDVDIDEEAATKTTSGDIDDMAAEEKRLLQQLSRDDFDEEYLLQKISMLQLRLDEAQKTIQAERDDKHELHKNIEKLTLDCQDVRARQEELRAAKQEAVRELLTLQEQHRAEMRIINNSLQEEVASRENLERRLSELRIELERLQAENASEWGKRERLETEKLALERDNKKLRSELRDYQERSDRKSRPLQASDVEVRALQQELTERNKEMNEMKLAHSKLKKLYAENNTELVHAVRRAEQYESEVKRLRQRVEELKRELASAEDELDSAANQVRRLQRTNDELVGQSEGLQVQIQHLQTRHFPNPQLRGGGSSSNGSVGGSGVQLRNKIAVELPTECLPNINDLRQIFDDSQAGLRSSSGGVESKRSSCSERTLADAKLSHVEDNIGELKCRNTEFERAKQKFDNPIVNMFTPHQPPMHSVQQSSSSSSSSQHHHHHHHQHQQQRHHHQQQQQQQQQQREPRERSMNRYGSGSNSSNRSNLALPLKGTTSSVMNGGSSGGGGSNTKLTHSVKDDINRQLFDEYAHGGGGAGGVGGVGGVVGVGVGIDNLVNVNAGNVSGVGNGIQYQSKKDKSGTGSGYARNSVNLDGLKVSDDETP